MLLEPCAKEIWQDDEAATQCRSCARFFSFTRRKHHCRFCGDIFCDACSKGRVQNHRACVTCVAKAGSATNSPPPASTRDLSMDGIDEEDRYDATPVPISPHNSGTNGVKSSTREDSPGPHDTSKDLSMDFETPQKTASPHTPQIMSPQAPPTPMFKPGTDPQLLEEIQLHRARIAVLEGQIAQLMPELTQVKQGFSNACTNLVRITEERRRTEQEQCEKVSRKTSILRRADEEVTAETAARKAAFEKRTHHSHACEICNFEYRFTAREHHCRVCYRSVCSMCAPKDAELRRCDWCVTRDMLQYDEFRERLLACSVSEALSWMSIFETSAVKIWEGTVHPSPPVSPGRSQGSQMASPTLTPQGGAVLASTPSCAQTARSNQPSTP